MKPVVVVDIDGVLANCDARHATLDRSNPDWQLYHSGMEDDPVNEGVAAIVQILSYTHWIFLLTNRAETYREPTRRWLHKHRIPYHGLKMRAVGAEYKGTKVTTLQGWIDDGFKIQLVLEDDPQHCAEIKEQLQIPVLYVHSGYYDLGRLETNYAAQDPQEAHA